MQSSLDAHKKQLTAAVQSLMTTSIPASLPRIEGLLTTHFPYASPSAATKAYTDALAQSIQASANNGGNGPIADAIDAVADEVSAAVDAIISIERFIQLSTPKMEDGNNFGVSVQMTVSKELKDIREALGKVTAGFPDYFDKRAGAFEKISNLPSETQSTSESSSSSTGGKEGDEKKSSSSTSTEKKQSTREVSERNQHKSPP